MIAHVSWPKGAGLGWHTLATAAVVGGIIHIVSTLAIPLVGSGAAVARLEQDVPLHRMTVLPRPAPGRQPVAFADPTDRLAVCRFDLRRGPIKLDFELADRGWTLNIHSREGDSFYALAATKQHRGAVSLTIEPPRDRLLGIFVLPQPPPIDPNRVIAPDFEGIAVIRAPSRGVAFAVETEKVLARASCVPLSVDD